jgi:hypothetical protein
MLVSTIVVTAGFPPIPMSSSFTISTASITKPENFTKVYTNLTPTEKMNSQAWVNGVFIFEVTSAD